MTMTNEEICREYRLSKKRRVFVRDDGEEG